MLLNATRNDNVNRVNILTLFDDFPTFLVCFLDRFHPDLNNLVTSQVRKQWTVGKYIVKPDLLSLELIKVNVNNSPVNLLPQIFKFSSVKETFLMKFCEFFFLVVQQDSRRSCRVNCLNNLRVVCLKFGNVSDRCLSVLFNLLQDHFQVFCIEWESRMEGVFGLFAGLNHDDSDLIHEVNL